MSRKAFLTVISFIVSFAVYAQNIAFEEQTHDFGTIKEEDGPVTHEFQFTNTGDSAITITRVKASCGCTTPGWTKEPVEPGETGFVQAQYNTFNRPGRFHKSLTVYTSASDKPMSLFIKGDVTPKPMTIEDELPTVMGAMRVKYRTFNMGKVLTREEPTTQQFEVYNDSDEILVLKQATSPSYINVVLPDTISPKERGMLAISYDAKEKGDLGFFSENITIVTNESEDSIKSFTVFANVEEYFPPMTSAELAEAPRLFIEEPIHDFDRAMSGEKITHTYELFNQGKKPLNIRKLAPNCSCLQATMDAMIIQPGKKGTIKLIFDSQNRRGNQQKVVTIYSNDPSGPVKRVTIKGYVESAN